MICRPAVLSCKSREKMVGKRDDYPQSKLPYLSFVTTAASLYLACLVTGCVQHRASRQPDHTVQLFVSKADYAVKMAIALVWCLYCELSFVLMQLCRSLLCKHFRIWR